MTPGTMIMLGGNQYTLAPLNFAALIQHEAAIGLISSMSGIPTEQHLDAIIDIVLASLQRNHAEFNKEDLMQLLDMGNMTEIINIIMGNSGLKKTVIVPPVSL
jgi:hypothetical protein